MAQAGFGRGRSPGMNFSGTKINRVRELASVPGVIFPGLKPEGDRLFSGDRSHLIWAKINQNTAKLPGKTIHPLARFSIVYPGAKSSASLHQSLRA